MLKAARSYEEACRSFRWRLPERYNAAFDVCDRQTMAGADGHRTALIVETADGSAERCTFHVLRLLSNRLANVLTAKGVLPGDCVALSLPPSVDAAAALIAVLKMGAVAVPLPQHLGEEPLAWRLADSGAVAVIAGEGSVRRIMAAQESAPRLQCVLAAGEAPAGALDMWAEMESAPDGFSPAVTGLQAPAFLFYPEHSAGKPQGVLHGHGSLLGNLPGVEYGLGFFPQFGDILWTSADWMSFEALMWAVLPAWHHGVPVVAGPLSEDPDAWLGIMARQGVRSVWMPPRHLERLTERAAQKPHPMPRVLGTGPEPLTAAQHDKIAKVFGTHASEIWGTVETGAACANNAAVMELRPGSPGRAVPGITVEAVDKFGRVLRAGEAGLLSVAPNAPGACLGRWKTGGDVVPGRLANGWLPGPWSGSRDLDGYVWPEKPPIPAGLVRLNGGQVIDLEELEAALCTHSRVAAAGAVLLPGGELKAFIVPQGGIGDVHLARELQAYAAALRSAFEVPARVEFVDAIPVRADGKTDAAELMSRVPTLDAPDVNDRLV